MVDGTAQLRPLDLSDAGALAQVHAQSFERAWSVDSFHDLLPQAGVFGYGYEAVILNGFILCRHVAEEAEILTVAVRPDQRRTGLGFGLVCAALDHCRKQGIERFFLEVAENNQPAVALYLKLGFSFIGKRPNYYGAQAGLTMQLDLGTQEEKHGT
jgi:ribosomal-protein-alanine N-acetyltransferase